MRISRGAITPNLYLQLPSAKVGPLIPDLLQLIGLNPKYHTPGGRLCTLPPKEYNGCARALRSLGAKGIYPFHPPAPHSALEMVLAGEINYLPKAWRVIGLPQQNGHALLTIFHEILHDIYFSNNFGLPLRRAFVLTVLDACRKLGPLDNFLHGVENKSVLEKPLTDILLEKDAAKIISDPEFQFFAAECFAYAGEAILLQDQQTIAEIPPAVVAFFRRHEIAAPVKEQRSP